MKRKPYKSLEQVYLSESFAKPVPLLPRQTILGEADGMAEVLIQKDTGPDLPVYRVPNEVADQILKQIQRSEISGTDKEASSVNSIIAKCLEIDKWALPGEGHESSVFYDVTRAFDKVGVNYKEFKNLEALQSDKNNPIRTKLLADSEVHKLDDLLSDKFKSLFVTSTDAVKLLQILWGILPKSTVNVGPGELALTLISDAKKGDEGDLEFDFGHVEVKGNNAALGSGKVATTEAYKELDRILSANTGGTTIQSFNIQAQKDIIYKHIRDLMSKYSGYINPQKRQKKFSPEDTKLHQSIYTALDDLSKKINEAEDIQELINDINNSKLPMKKNVRSRKTGQIEEKDGEKLELLKKVDTLQQIKSGKVTSITGGQQSRFFPAVQSFFSHSLSPEIKIEGTKYLRSHASTNQNEIAEVAQELLQDYPELLTYKSSTTCDLYRFIGAIHVAEYQQEKRFKYIVFFNSDENNKTQLPTKIVSLQFTGTGNTFKEDIKRVFQFFKRDNINASISLGVDNQRGTVRVALGR